MPTEILMPALSPTMEEGKLAKWLVKRGPAGEAWRHHRRDRDRQGHHGGGGGRRRQGRQAAGRGGHRGREGQYADRDAAAGRGERPGTRPPSSRPQRLPLPRPGRRLPKRHPRRRQRPNPPAVRPSRRLPRRPRPTREGGGGRGRDEPRAYCRGKVGASLPRRWRAGSPKSSGLTLPTSTARVRAGASCSRDVEAALQTAARGAAEGRHGGGARCRRPALRRLQPMARRQDPRALRARLLRGRAARRHAPDHRPAPHASPSRPSRTSISPSNAASTSCCARASA